MYESDLQSSAGVRLLSDGSTQLNEHWVHQLYAPYWRLYWHAEAGASVHSPDQTYVLQAQCWWLIPAWTHLTSSCEGSVMQRHIHFHWAAANEAWCQEWCPQPVILEASEALRVHHHALLAADVRSVVHRLIAFVHHACATVLEDLPLAAQRTPMAKSDPLQPARIRVMHSLRQPPSIAALAEECGYSVDHFNRLVRQFEGCTARQWVERQRIGLAAAELAHLENDIASVAERFGYSDRFHFSKAFRRVMHAAPGAWRARQQAIHAV
jgi:AraC-like DNA-binding protein